jgi:Flp pilus assembly protein TadG
MKAMRVWFDEEGATAVELALTLPFFLILLFGAVECGLLLWAQVSLQHGVEMAARCAVIDTNTCSSASTTQSYASGEAFGLNPPSSTFTVSTPSCGEEVAASYTFQFLTQYFVGPITLTASSCFPK